MNTEKPLAGFNDDVHFRAPGDFMARVHYAARTKGMTASNFMRAAIVDALDRSTGHTPSGVKLSLRQAAEHADVAKSTILRAVQKGKLAADRTDDGGYAIDPAELMRVYGEKAVGKSNNNSVAECKLYALQVQIDGLKAQIDWICYRLDD